MPSFDIVKTSNIKNTFRVNSVLTSFDLKPENVGEHIKGNIPIENKDWNIMVIYGESGTGKSTIAKQIFGDLYFEKFDYSAASLIDDMPKSKNVDEIIKVFCSCGLGTAHSWLKPYSVLSTGEKYRADLARCILEDREMIIFDEFTSVVDRSTAITGAVAISKSIRKMNKKFVAITCHDDILPYMSPDAIYNTNIHQFFFTKNQKNALHLMENYLSYQSHMLKSYGNQHLKNFTI